MAEQSYKYRREDFSELPVKLNHLTIYLNFLDEFVEATNLLDITSIQPIDLIELEPAGRCPQSIPVRREWQQRVCIAPEDDRANPIVRPTVDEVSNHGFRRLEACGSNVGGFHRAGHVEGEDDLDAAHIRRVPCMNALRSGESDDEQRKRDGSQSAGQVDETNPPASFGHPQRVRPAELKPRPRCPLDPDPGKPSQRCGEQKERSPGALESQLLIDNQKLIARFEVSKADHQTDESRS